MKSVLLLTLRYLRFNKIKTAILVFSVAVAVFLPLAVNLLVRDYQRNLLARAAATPLIAGAPGSRLDLVLHALYFRGKPAHDLVMSDLDAINASGLAMGLPILNKYTARDKPIVGTSLEYFDFRGLRVAAGAGMTRLGDCVLGATAAETLGLRPGETLMSDPENVLDLAGSYPINMRVTGILAANGTADDGAVFVDITTVWLIMGIMHGHQDAAAADPSLLLQRDANHVTASAALLPYQEVTPENVGSFHVHGDPATFPIGVVVVVPHDEKSAAILRGRYQDPKATVQLLAPQQVVARDARPGLSRETVLRRPVAAGRSGHGTAPGAGRPALAQAAAGRDGDDVQDRLRAADGVLAASCGDPDRVDGGHDNRRRACLDDGRLVALVGTAGGHHVPMVGGRRARRIAAGRRPQTRGGRQLSAGVFYAAHRR